MILSVVIVSYNVKFFLEQCLSSLRKAIEGFSMSGTPAEVIIIDNASSDGSLEFLQPLFPAFHFIRNNENTGFAKACNQGIALCNGEFVLFLNPDTILPEDSLDICVSFFRSTPEAGALGVKMVDGSGRYLKESKRGFPDLRASFFKMTGLTRMFPRSKKFASYYMGDLDEEQSHQVDILSGAFMMVRHAVLNKVGGFDERFFMYAEDIDLSYRFEKAGFKNYYLSKTTIIHFKGESTRKDFRYAKIFYDAMGLFMEKHFKGTTSFFQRLFATVGMRLHQMMFYLLIPFGRSEKISKTVLRVYVKGDPDAQNKLHSKLAEKHIPFTENENSVEEEIIFCEGPALSWKMIIKEITDHPGRLVYSFHGHGTHASVSSWSSRQQGAIFEW